ncbi:MAG: hypothetical protein WED05_10975 [Candidatus Atabeyarchaeum deiterrae]
MDNAIAVGKNDSGGSHKYGSFGVLLTVMIIALVFAFTALVIELGANVSRGPFYFGSGLLLVNVAVLVLGISIAVLIFYGLLKGSVTLAVRVAIAIFVLSATVSLLMYANLFLGYYGLSSPAIRIGLSMVAYLGSFAGILAVFDVLSRNSRNVLFAFYSSVIGAFMGVLIPSIAMIVLLCFLAGLDLYLTLKQTVKKTKRLHEDYESIIILKMSYAGRDWAIGIGDLVSYSILVTNTLVNFGLVATLLSLFLVLLGSVITSRRARKVGQVPGLPLAIALGLIPVFVYILVPGLP